MVGVIPKMDNERLQIELYQLFREYSGVDIGYNDFLPLLEELTLKVKMTKGESNELNTATDK